MSENTEKKYSEDIVNLVVARMEGLPSGVAISIGGGESGGKEGYRIDNLIEHIKAQDEVGRKIIDIQLAYIRSFKSAPQYAVANN